MLCPRCNAVCSDADRFCCNCGAPLYAPAQERKGRRWVPILIMVLLSAFGIGLFFAFPGNHQHSGVTDSETPWFSLDNGVLYFDKKRYDGDSELTIPASIGTETVKALSEDCFENCTDLTAIFLPDTLQAIGEDAFRGCTSLRGMDIPDSVSLIGEGAFHGCTALEAVRISDQVKVIGSGAFDGCSKLQFIYFLGEYALWTGLYSEFIAPNTTVFCNDGSYPQGEISQ